ncbi:MAG TPA: RHS repeat-associated core domain-containing protein [Pyrinomonadaceae bacterium]|nr:RHS repeat-associated core domain-containing protein [Pyrinomonadaceae bacterium]
MKAPNSSTAFLLKAAVCCSVALIVFVFLQRARAQSAITLQGHVFYEFPDNSLAPAAGVTVKMTKTIASNDNEPIVTTETTTTDGNGHYSFESELRCNVSYEMDASSSDLIDDEPLPPSSKGGISGCVGDATLGYISIKSPMPITFGGYVLDEKGNHWQGVTVTMTRTKYDVNPNVVTTASTTTDANGHYLLPSYSRCSVSVKFVPSIGGHEIQAYINPSGCLVGSYDNLNLVIPDDTKQNTGKPPCNGGAGDPVNVTNGNMSLEQTDYHLPGVGAAIDVTRSYNSLSQGVGLFGRGWTTLYDETVNPAAGNLLEFRMADGRVVTGDLTPDFFGTIVKNSDSSYTVNFKDGRRSQFNAAGRLASLRDRNGNQTTLSYDINGYLRTVTDPFGRVLSFTTNDFGRVVSISDSLGAVATYAYDSDRLLSVTYADNSAYSFSYTFGGGGYVLTDVRDALGNTLEHHDYDTHTRAITSERQGGVQRYVFGYVSPMETDVTDGLGHLTKYFFHSVRGRDVVTAVEGLCGCGGGSQLQTWAYDDRANVSAMSDALNHTTTFTYDNNGNRLTATNATGTVSYTYNQFGEMLTRKDQLQGVLTNAFDAQGNLLTTRDQLNRATNFDYNTRGQLLTLTNARGKVTSFSYDAAGNLAQARDANNITTFYFYDARGRLTKVRDPLSRNSLYAYDAAGRINRLTHADNSFVSFGYDLAGRPTSTTDERGFVSRYFYDADYHLTSISDALGHTTSFTYDAMSNLTGVTDALGRVANYEYDSFDRLVKIVLPPAGNGATRLFETFAYNAVGNVTQRTDTAGRTTSYSYDNVNRPASVIDPAGKTTTVEYDALSRTIALTDALSQRYQFVYDAVGQQTLMNRAGVSLSYAYDAGGNVVQRTDYNGNLTNYTYDNLDRLTTVTYPNRTATYSYDPLGNVTRATNENGSVYIGYDNRYRVASFSDPFYYGVSYNYDAAGNRTKISLNGATYATYTYDAVNRLTNLKDGGNLNFTQTYDAVNRLISRTAPNGVNSTFAYDDLNRLTALTHTAGTNTLSANQYTYNDAGNIASWTNASGAHAFSYDAIDRLLAATNNAQPNESYSYDGVGNRASSHFSASYSYQPFNRLSGTAAASYVYDNNGNLTSKTAASGTTTYVWNEENQLTQVGLAGALNVDYKYDALGRRIQRTTSGGASERYVYDGQDVLLDLNADWSVATKYLNNPGIDNHLRQTSATTGTAYYLTDHLGSTAALTDNNAGLLEQLNYDSFGNSNGSSRTRYTYTGRERDPDTGLLHYRARFYDPQIGRFISEDPIGLAGGINQYGYVSGSPLNATDPSGLGEIDTHYYLTYYLALRTGCFKEWEAHDIANEDQLTDENPETAPGRGNSDKQRMQNRVFHALHPGAAEGVGSPLLWAGAMRESSGHQWIGRYLHYLQDTFSHADFTDDTWGHSPLNALPGFGNGMYGDHGDDKTASDPPRAMRMAGATWIALVQYAKEKGCTCDPRWDPAWWKQVADFAIVRTDHPHISSIDATERSLDNPGLGDPGALRKKRRILGLPDRDSGEW